jgi:hypothetical protein
MYSCGNAGKLGSAITKMTFSFSPPLWTSHEKNTRRGGFDKSPISVGTQVHPYQDVKSKDFLLIIVLADQSGANSTVQARL